MVKRNTHKFDLGIQHIILFKARDISFGKMKLLNAHITHARKSNATDRGDDSNNEENEIL